MQPASAASGYTIHVNPTGCTTEHEETAVSFDPTGTSPPLTAQVSVVFSNDSSECGAHVTVNGHTIYVSPGTGTGEEFTEVGYFPYAWSGAPSGTYAGRIHVVAPQPSATPKPKASRTPLPRTTPSPPPSVAAHSAPTVARSVAVATSTTHSPKATATPATVAPTQPSTGSPTTSPAAVARASGNESPGVSPVAAIGLGVGAGAAVVGIAAILMTRRSRSRTHGV